MRAITVDELVTSARGWIGVPFLHQGRNRHGIDCIGFIIMLLRAVDALPIEVEKMSGYGRRASPDLFEGVNKYCIRTPTIQPGVLILMKWPREEHPRHAALYVRGTIIHSYYGQGVIEVSYGQPWTRYAHSFYKLPGVVYGTNR